MFLFWVQGLVEFVGEQEETGLNFKRPLLASSTEGLEQQENCGGA